MYFHINAHGSISWTNPENGKTFTHVFSVLNKDLHITDNGDGTITVVGFGTGSDKFYANGELVLRNRGRPASRSSSTSTARRTSSTTTSCSRSG